MRVGDAALLGLEIRRGGTVERQLLLLEVRALPVTTGANGAPVRLATSVDTKVTLDTDLDPTVEQRTWTLHPIDVRLARYDADGTLRAESTARLHEEALANGWWP